MRGTQRNSPTVATFRSWRGSTSICRPSPAIIALEGCGVKQPWRRCVPNPSRVWYCFALVHSCGFNRTLVCKTRSSALNYDNARQRVSVYQTPNAFGGRGGSAKLHPTPRADAPSYFRPSSPNRVSHARETRRGFTAMECGFFPSPAQQAPGGRSGGEGAGGEGVLGLCNRPDPTPTLRDSVSCMCYYVDHMCWPRKEGTNEFRRSTTNDC